LTASYYYDPFGRRLWKEVAGVRTYFVYADEGLVAEADGAGTVTKTYGYRPGSTWTTDPLFMRQAGQYYFYQNDHLGTPQKMTSLSGAMVWRATYKSFGEVEIWAQSSVVNNLRFPGQYYDSDTDLIYNHHRYFDSKTGRYISSDRIGLEGGINLFQYCENNPITLLDPYGLQAIALPAPAPIPILLPKTQDQLSADRQLSNAVYKAWMDYVHPPLIAAGHFLYRGGLGEWLYDKFHPINSPADPTDIRQWEEWPKEHDKKISEDTCSETRTPWMGPGKGWNPNEPPEGPWWKKAVWAMGRIIKLIKGWPH
jgi:RHS repeat-associated protein